MIHSTPTPWRLVSGEVWRDETVIAQMHHGPGNGTLPEERDANARRIVLAVNCHDDMLATFNLIDKRLDIAAKEVGDGYMLSAIHPEIKALIAKATPTC